VSRRNSPNSKTAPFTRSIQALIYFLAFL